MRIVSRCNQATLVLTFCVLIVASACKPEDRAEETTPQEQAKQDSIKVAREQRLVRIDSIENMFGAISYHRLSVSNSRILDSVRKTFAKTKATWDNYRVLTLLNRKDIQFVRIGDSLVMPDTIVKDLRAYSVFPPWYPAGEGKGKLVFISNKWQCYACYDNGMLVRFAAANTGEEGKPTLPGRYAVNWRQWKRISSLDSTWILPFTVNFHLYAGNAFHQFEMPGRPVSHSCVRQFLADAEWLFKWVKPGSLDTNRRIRQFTGTPVIILDMFDYSRRRGGPWLELTSSKATEVELPKDPLAIEEALIPISQIPKDVRGALVDRNRYVTAEQVLRDRGVLRKEAHLKESIDFNKLRRQKAKQKLKEKENQKKNQELKVDPTSNG